MPWISEKTDLNWTLLWRKMLILCIFLPNIESWRLGSTQTHNLASTDFLNTGEIETLSGDKKWFALKLLTRTQWQCGPRPIKQAQLYLSDQKWFESQMCRCRKWIVKNLLQFLHFYLMSSCNFQLPALAKPFGVRFILKLGNEII